MDKWQTELQGSSFRANLSAFLAQLDDVDFKSLTDMQREYLERAKTIADYADSILESVDASVVSWTAVNDLGSYFSSASTSLRNWSDTQNDTYLSDGYLNSNLNSIVDALARLTPSVTPKSASGVVSSLRRSVAQHQRSVERALAELEDKKVALSEKLEVKVNETEEEIEGLAASTDKLKTRVLEIGEEGTKALAAQSSSFTKMLSQNEQLLEKRISEIKSGIEEDTRTISQTRIDAEKLLEIVSEDVMVGDYSKNAKENRNRSDVWMAITVVMVAIAACVSLIFIYDVNADTPWQKIAMRVVLVGALSGAAAYSARQGAEHRRAQRSAEVMALQLRAVKPYLEGIGTELRDGVLVSVADRLFGRHPEDSKVKDEDEVEVINSAQIVKLLVAFLEKKNG